MTPAFASFAEQALRYYDRPHERIPDGPIDSRAAWRGVDLRAQRNWEITLSTSQIDALERAATAVADRPLGEIRRTDFVIPELAPALAAWRDELRDGRGFVLLRGLPVARWGDALSAIAYWGLGQQLGWPGAQNAHGELLGHVIDTGEDHDNPFVRRYRTAGAIAYHCDLADVVGLLCLRASRAGGASRIVSSVTVWNELHRRHPELVARLFEPFALDRRDEQSADMPWVPVIPCRYAGGRLRTFYHSDYFRSATRHASVAPFTAVEQLLLDHYEAIAAEPRLRLDMEFAPGDIQLISNHTVLHARAAYVDDLDGAHRRHLLRLWLTLDSAASVRG